MDKQMAHSIVKGVANNFNQYYKGGEAYTEFGEDSKGKLVKVTAIIRYDEE